MHIFRLRKLNQRGFDHVLAAVACFVIVGLVGTGLLVESHAATAPQWTGVMKAYSSNATLGAGDCLTTIANSNSGAASGSEGAYAVLQPCSKTYDSAQVWSLNDTRTITFKSYAGVAASAWQPNVQEFTLQSAAGSNECLNDWQATTKQGTQVRLYPCGTNGTAAANDWVWESKLSGASPHYLMNLAASSYQYTGTHLSTDGANTCLDDNSGSSANDAKVDVYACVNGHTNEEWFEEPAPAKSSSTTPTPVSTSWSGALQNGNASAKLCMNDNNSSTAESKPIGIYTCEKNVVSEKWTIAKNSSGQFLLKNGQGICASTPNSNAQNDIITDTSCSTSDNTELWTWSGHQLENVASKTCINDPNSSTTNGTQLTVTSCSGDPASENWSEESQANYAVATGGTASGSTTVAYTGGLKNGNASKALYMNDNGSSTKSGTTIGIYSLDNTNSEKWSILQYSNGDFLLKNGTGVCAAASSIGSQANLVTDTSCTNDQTEVWEWDGSQIENVASKTCINDPSSSTTNGTGLTVTSCSGDYASENWSKAAL